MSYPKSRFRWSDAASEAAVTITRRPVRTLLTALGTILGVGAFVVTTGLADTARAQVSSRFDALKATEVRIQDANPDGIDPFPDDTDRRLEALNGINHAGIIYTVDDSGTLEPRNTATRSVGTHQAALPIVAATPGALQATLPTVATGRLYDQFHQSRAERVALVGRAAADRLGITRLDNQPAVFIGDNAYVVLGILDDVQRVPSLLLSVIIPTSTEAADISVHARDYQVIIDTAPGAANLVGRQAPVALRPQQPGRLHAIVPPVPETLRNRVESDVTNLYYILAGLALLIGTIAIANSMFLSVIERRPEIGLRRALGAKRRHIAAQIVLEAAIIGTAAAVAGMSIAIIAVVVVSDFRGWTVTINPVVYLAAPIIGLVTGAGAGSIPASRAARTPPATALST